jgi:FKBP-type peptidyl-prolyl cis-trans isomerase SlyD
MDEFRPKVKDNMMVSINYTLTLGDGKVEETTEGREPFSFIQGRGRVCPGLEKALYGMRVGEEKDLDLEPEDGYGVFDPDAFDTLARDLFPEDIEIGQQAHIRDKDAKVIHVGYISKISDKEVEINFNHPLADQKLHFHVEVVGIRPATTGELNDTDASHRERVLALNLTGNP